MAFSPKLMYKGRPLVRCGNEIYYGTLADPYVVYLQILTTKKEKNVEVADKVHVVVLNSDAEKPLPERIVKQATKTGLFEALSYGEIVLRSQEKTVKN